MKRFNSQPVKRKIKKGSIRFFELPFIINEDGTNKKIKQRKTKRCRWINI